jgi:hypothetical protein
MVTAIKTYKFMIVISDIWALHCSNGYMHTHVHDEKKANYTATWFLSLKWLPVTEEKLTKCTHVLNLMITCKISL